MTTGVTCQVRVDGQLAADGSPDDPPGAPTILDDLAVTWGRPDTMTQPDPDTCTFTVADPTGTYRVGHRVDVEARGDTYPDPTVPTFTNGGFEVATVTWSTSGGTATRTATRKRTGGYSLAVQPTTAGAPVSVLLAPAPFEAPGTNPDAWDAIATTAAGQTWAATVSVWVPGGASVSVRAALFTGPYATAGTPAGVTQVVDGDGAWHTLTATHVVQVDGQWVGLYLTLDPTGPAWDEMPPSLTWDGVDPTVSWDDQGTVYVDDAQVTSPTGGTGRGVLVFSGRITDLRASWDAGPVLEVTAAGFTADLDNRTISDEPWVVETVAARAHRILTLAGLPIDIDIDTSIDQTLLTWLDVDAQGATELLQNIAQSVDGVLWPAVHQSLGAYLRLEDPALRVSLLGLVEVPSGPPPVVLRRNRLPNPSLEVNGQGWAVGSAGTGGTATSSVPKTGGASGVAFFRLTQTVPNTAGTAFVTCGNAATSFASVTPGAPAYASIAVRCSVARRLKATIVVHNTSAGGGWSSASGAIVTVPANVWTRLPVATITPGPGYLWARVLAEFASGEILPAGGTLDVDAALVGDDPSGVYFDGSTPDTPTEDYAWTGAVHASPSTLSSVQPPPTIEIGQGDPNTGHDLSACMILRDPITWVQDVSDVVTRVAVGWNVQGVDTDGLTTTTEATEQLVDVALEVQHGTRRVQVSTDLQSAADAADVAQRILSRSTPVDGWRAEGLTIDDDDVLASSDGVALVLDLLDGTSRIGAPLVLGDLPFWSPAGADAGVYLEGGTYRFVGGRWVLDLTVSGATGQGGSAAWDELDPTWIWNQWDPGITWNDLRGVAAD